MSQASHHTDAANRSVAADLPLADPADLRRVRHGRIAGLDRLVVHHDRSGEPILDTADWDFLDSETAPPSVNPSLWRQARLNREHGLYELVPGLYQVRGYDLANLSLVRGETGWIVIDPLTSTETARAAMDLVREHLGDRPVSAVIYTHSHIDHFAGLAGVVPLEELAARRVPVVAPQGFLEEAVSENVLAGPAMVRRAGYMYGNALPRGEFGHVDCGLGRSVPGGSISLVGPTHEITATGEELTLDGVRIVFQLTPDRAREDFAAGEYRWVAQVVNHVVFADPGNTDARELQAAALEQLGFQAESGAWRNFYLSGAQELRRPAPGSRSGRSGRSARGGAGRSPLMRAMTVEMVFDLLGVRLDGPRADGTSLAVGWSFPDTGEEWTLRLEHGALNSWPSLDADADVVVTMPRTALTAVIADPGSLASRVQDGSVAVDGDAEALRRLFGLLVQPAQDFAIVEP